MAPTSSLARFVVAISIPVLILVCLSVLPIVNFKRGGDLWLPSPVPFLLIRVSLVALAGFLVAHRAGLSVWAALGAGAVAFFAEQVLVAGVWFVINGQADTALKVLQAFFLFVWVPIAIAGVGGLVGKAWRSYHNSGLHSPS